MNLPIKKLADVPTPEYKSKDAAAFDLYAAQGTTIYAGERAIIPSGIAVAIPKSHVGLIWDRSGLAAKHGMHCLAGVIDSDYRGEIGIVLYNTSNAAYEVTKGDRIAQMLIQPVVQCDIQEFEQLEETQRADGGFGSTGK